GHHPEHDRGLPRAQGRADHHPARRAELQLRAPARRHGGRDGRRPRGAQRRDGRTRRGHRAAGAPARPFPGSASVNTSVLSKSAGSGEPRWQALSDFDWKPVALVPLLAALALPAVGSGSTWLTLTVAGLAMGLIVFIIASGLTLVFGLMDVLNFGHGVFIALGAFVAVSVFG